MNGVFQAVTVIDTIIFWKVKDLLMWQTTVWETLNLHNSHCFQLNAWHDRLPAWEEEEVKRTAATSAGGSSVSKHSFPSEGQEKWGIKSNALDQQGWAAAAPPSLCWCCSSAAQQPGRVWRGPADSLEGLLQPPAPLWGYSTSTSVTPGLSLYSPNKHQTAV